MKGVRGRVAGAVVLALAAGGAWLGMVKIGSGQQTPALPPLPMHKFAWQDNFPRWALPPGEEVYGSPALEGKHLKPYIDQFDAIATRYRDAGHKYWGRITGSEADVWAREWCIAKLKAVGVTDVVDVPMDLTEPQWFGTAWEVTATGTQTLKIESAQPYTGSVPTAAGGIDLEPVWLGLGSPADFKGRDVKGKAAIIFGYMYGFTSNARFYGGVEKAFADGAAAIFLVNNIPGNLKIQSMLSGPGSAGAPKMTVPIFSVGKEDGEELRKLIEAGPTKMHVQLSATTRTGLKSGNVWGTLPGVSKEEIVILAHRDGFFEGAGDNASGIAVMLGLAEYFAKIPQARRPRTIKFLASTGHHHSGLSGPRVIAAEKDKFLANAVFLINLEHVAWTNTVPHSMGSPKPVQRFTTGVDSRRWFAYSSDKVVSIFLNAFRDFGVGTWNAQDAANPGEGSPFSRVLPNIGFISSPVQMHTDADTAIMIPATGLEQIARATAKIVTEVAKLPVAEIVSK